MQKTELEVGMVVQLDPDKCKNPMLAACMMTVSEPKSWGAQGYIQATGEGGKMGGQAYYRATWEEMELVGRAVWMTGSAANIAYASKEVGGE
jgi:hypothetical protein